MKQFARSIDLKHFECVCVINFVNPAILMSYARSQYGIGNTQILIDLAWGFSEHLLKGELHIKVQQRGC